MEKFINSLPEDGKRAVESVTEYYKSHAFKIQEWKGVQLIPAFSKEAAQFAYEEWSPRSGDVFVATYPKAGTHWMDEIVRQILFIGDTENYDLMVARGRGLLRSQDFVESGPASKFVISDYFPCPRVFATHLPEELINYKKIQENGAKVIYVYRNPKDLAVSYFHFSRKRPYPEEIRHFKDYDWNQHLESLLSGQQHTAVPPGEWYPYHIKSWIKHKGDGTIMFVSFEDLKKDLPSELGKIAEFLKVKRTQAEIEEIARRCTFETMKEANKGQILSSVMYRKGQVGEWKGHFTVAQSEMMDRKLEEELAGVDIMFTYEI